MRPLDDFMEDRSYCRPCHNSHCKEHRRRQAASGRLRRLQHLQYDLRRKRTAEALLGVVTEVAEEAFGGVSRMATAWGEMLREAGLHDKIQGAKTLLHVATVAELARILEEETTHPEEVIKHLHAEGRLLATLREMVADDTLTLDMLDPPPDPV